jgi:phage terminase small subunit
MGLRGPAKKPTALEAAQGFPGKRAVNDHEPQFAEGEPDMPRGLSRGARRIWRITVAILLRCPGLLTIADGAVLADYCEVRADKDILQRAMRDAERRNVAQAIEQAKAKGLTLTKAELRAAAASAQMTKSGQMLNTLRNRENVLRREIGLSASARSSIRLTIAQFAAGQDPEDAATFARGPQLLRV